MTHDEIHRIAHETAVRQLTAERYLLGELTDVDAEAFEAHFFDCSACTATLRAGATMFAAAPEALKSESLNPEPLNPQTRVLPFVPRQRHWLATAAAAVLAFLLGNVFPLLRLAPAIPQMAVATPGGVIDSETRAEGSDEYPVHFEGNRARIEELHIHDRRFPRYRIELRDGQRIVTSSEATAADVRREEGIPLLLQPLPVGRYELSVEGVPTDGNRSLIYRKIVVVR